MPTGREIEAVVFDVGETLVDETRAWAEIARSAGVPALTLFGALGGLIERGRDHRQVWELLGVPRPQGVGVIDAGDLYPDAAGCLEELARAGYRLGAAGNQPVEAEQHLRAAGLPLQFVLSSARAGVEKPSPAFFAAVQREARAPAAQIAYVGDRVDNDVLPAKAFGMFTVFLVRGPWAVLQRERPAARHADAVLTSLSQLPGLLAGGS